MDRDIWCLIRAMFYTSLIIRIPPLFAFTDYHSPLFGRSCPPLFISIFSHPHYTSDETDHLNGAGRLLHRWPIVVSLPRMLRLLLNHWDTNSVEWMLPKTKMICMDSAMCSLWYPWFKPYRSSKRSLSDNKIKLTSWINQPK